MAERGALVTLAFLGASSLGCEEDLAARNQSRSVHFGGGPFEESLGREAQATHEIPEARVGPNRVECGLHLEPCQVYITIRVGLF